MADVAMLVGAAVAYLVVVVIAVSPTREWWYDDLLPWIEPVATTGALLAASVAVYFAYRAFEIERRAGEIRDEEVRERTREAERAQAAKVTAWLVFDREERYFVNSPVSPWRIVLSNTSDSAVYWVRPIVRMWSGHLDMAGEYPVLAPNEPQAPQGFDFHFGPRTELREHPLRDTDESPLYYIELDFTDAAGRRWLRTPSGLSRRGEGS